MTRSTGGSVQDTVVSSYKEQGLRSKSMTAQAGKYMRSILQHACANALNCIAMLQMYHTSELCKLAR